MVILHHAYHLVRAVTIVPQIGDLSDRIVHLQQIDCSFIKHNLPCIRHKSLREIPATDHFHAHGLHIIFVGEVCI